jgi:translation elongation factor EF-Tu-like GTPase
MDGRDLPAVTKEKIEGNEENESEGQRQMLKNNCENLKMYQKIEQEGHLCDHIRVIPRSGESDGLTAGG